METYEVLFKEGETTGVYGISLVNDPAMESLWIALSKEQEVKLSTVDQEKRIVCGAVLIPNKPIYRNQNGKEFNIVFPSETIELASQAFLENMHQKSSTLEHNVDSKLNDVCIVQTWIKEDNINDKSVMYGFNDPIGTWYASMKINNNEIWNDYVKTGKVKGFSIDGFFDLEQVNLKSDYMNVETIVNAIKDGFASLTLSKEEVKVTLGSINTADGSVKINFEGDTITAGSTAVTMTAPDGSELPLPDGEYTLEDGNNITVMGGIVQEVATAKEEATDEEAPTPQTPMSNDAPTVKSEKHTQEVFYQLSKEDFNAMIVEFANQVDTKINALKTELTAQPKEEVVELTKIRPAKEKSWNEMSALERFRATKL